MCPLCPCSGTGGGGGMCPLCPCSGTTAQYGGGACVPYVPVDYRDIGDTCSSSILCCSTTTGT